MGMSHALAKSVSVYVEIEKAPSFPNKKSEMLSNKSAKCKKGLIFLRKETKSLNSKRPSLLE